MASNINPSKKRFEDILKGRIRDDLKDFVKSDEIIGKKGKDKVSIPLKYINIPRFKHGQNEDESGMGEGEGDVGDPVAPGEQEGEGEGRKAGEGAGDHALEIDVTIEDLAQILQEELELPRIEPKGKKQLYTTFERYSGLRRTGPRSLFRFKPSFKEAMKRQIASGEYDYEDPRIIITKEDERYRSWKTTKKPETDAVVFYLMDVSGSMSERHKSIARKVSFWTDVWLRAHYPGLESIYVIHDYDAQEVDEQTFYHTTTSGGTRIWSGYNLINNIIEARYRPNDWNIYLFQYSDGDNWGDSIKEMEILDGELLPKVNLMGYGQIDIPWWAGGAYSNYFHDVDIEGQYIKDLEEYLTISPYADKVVTSRITGEDDIIDTIREFLGTGK